MKPRKPIVVAGHQPNYFPWFGFFEKMLKSDVFVFSDDVQYPKQCYTNRTEILINGRPVYLTLAVRKGNDQRIADKKYLKDKRELKKLVNTLNINIRRLPHGKEIDPIIDTFIKKYDELETVAELNIYMNQFIAGLFGISPEIKLGTDLELDQYRKNNRLIRRCQLLGASVYLCGAGADGYQDEAQINAAGIDLRRIEYAIGKEILGGDLPYSILVGIARIGIEPIREAVEKYKNDRVQ